MISQLSNVFLQLGSDHGLKMLQELLRIIKKKKHAFMKIPSIFYNIMFFFFFMVCPFFLPANGRWFILAMFIKRTEQLHLRLHSHKLPTSLKRNTYGY